MDKIITPSVVQSPPANTIQHTAQVSLTSRSPASVVHLVQYDTTTPIIAVALTANGQPYTVPNGAAVNIRLAKPDGTYVYNPAYGLSADSQTVYIAVTVQMTVCIGKLSPVVEVVIDGGTAATGFFVLDIDPNPIPEDAIASTDEYKTIQQLAAEVQEAAAIITENEQAIQDIEDNMDAIQGAAGNAQSAAASASQAQQYAAQAKDYADSINPDNFQQKAIIAEVQSATPKMIYPYVSQGRQVILTRDGYTFETWSIASPLIMSIIPKDISVNTSVGSVTYVMLYGNYQQSGGWNFYEFTVDTDEHCPYAVGDVYITSKAGNPSTRWPGTSWTQIKDCFLLAAGDSYEAGSTGGEATHTLTEAELPEISGSFGGTSSGNAWGVLGTSSGVFSRSEPIPAPTNTEKSSTNTRNATVNMSFGSGQAHNNMPPYLAVYVWKRTA